MTDRSARPELDRQPSVTVVIPTFNRAEFLDESIRSVLGQDYENLEVLVLDDGSTDETPKLLERHARLSPDRFRWDRHENMGQARTLNRGFEMAKGEIVGYLSSDDALLPRAIRKVAAALAADPDVVVAYPGWEYVDEIGKRMDAVMPEEFTLLHAVRMSDPVIGPGALFRRSVVDEVGGWDPEITYSPDFEFWVRVSRAGRFARVPETLARYRWHAGMTGRSSRGLDIVKERIAIVDRVYSGDVAPELAEVRDEAYRNAILAGAGLIVGNAPWERFVLIDRLVSRTFESPRKERPAARETLRERIAGLERELGAADSRLAALGDALARREIEIQALDGNG